MEPYAAYLCYTSVTGLRCCIGLRFYDIPWDISILSGTDGSVLVEDVPAVDLSGNGFQFLNLLS